MLGKREEGGEGWEGEVGLIEEILVDGRGEVDGGWGGLEGWGLGKGWGFGGKKGKR